MQFLLSQHASSQKNYYICQKSSSFFIARFFVRVTGAAAQNQTATLHGLPSHPPFRLRKVPCYSIQDGGFLAKAIW